MNRIPKILVVDDEYIIRATLDSLLSGENLELLFAENGEQGLNMAKEHQPDAILLDVMMPGMDGYETCRHIREDALLAEIPIIMITALDDRNARLVGLIAGADDFLTKPFDGFEIQVRVKNILRINRYRNLLEERSRFHWVVENAEKGYVLIDELGTIQYANQRAQVFLHLPKEYTNINLEEQAVRHYKLHFPDELPTNFFGIQPGYLVQTESPTAQAFWLRSESLASPFVTKKERLICLSDVTEEMTSYHDIRKVHLLVAHKLRTPISHIYGTMNFLTTNMDAVPDAQVKPLVKMAWAAADRLVQEVQDVLRYIDAPTSLSIGSPVSVSEVCDLVSSVCGMLEIKDVHITRDDSILQQKLGISACAMELVIYEILENSKKFHPAKTPHIQLEVGLNKGQFVELCISDDGPGMTAAQLKTAMQPYLQGEKWFTGEAPGMGLGLSMTASLIWQSNGNIHISNCNKRTGISITVELPVLCPA